MYRLILLALMSLTIFGCKHIAPSAECVDHQGSDWREVTSAHFRVLTNLNAQSAREAIIELEKVRGALLFAFRGGRNDPPGRMEAVILQSHEQLTEFAEEDFAGLMTYDERGPIIVIEGESYAFDASPNRRVLTHELAHYLSANALLRQPRWLAEGLASYLEMTRPYGDGEIRMGEVNLDLLLWNKTHARIPLEDLWRWNGDSELRQSDIASYYASSWLWVHFLLNQHSKEFSEFQGGLARAEDPRKAWSAAFAKVDGA